MIEYSGRYPIVIISTPRSGSTALTHYINQELNSIPMFSEPDTNPELFSSFLETTKISNQYIVKIHAGRFDRYPDYILDQLFNSDEPYKICIKRRNKIDQVVSLYIALCRNQWEYHNESQVEDTVPIDYPKVKKSIEILNDLNNQLEQAKIKFDTILWYEDFDFGELPVVKTPKPKNYEELYTIASKMYNIINEVDVI